MANSNFLRTLTLWSVTVLVTVSSILYQRMTGPTHPKSGEIEIGGQEISYSLLRSAETTGDAVMEIETESNQISGTIRVRRYKSHDEWTVSELIRNGTRLIVTIPKQPAAGKVMYQITLAGAAGEERPLTDEPVVIRFKGPVPLYVLIPHIVIMFTAMLLATRSGLEAIASGANTFRFALWTAGLLFLGGLILGPVVQKFAFDAYWTGWPFGHDLTDNKTLIAFLAWVIAIWQARTPGRGRAWIVTAMIVTLAVYLVPHSVLGSEIDYTLVESQ